MHFQSGNAICYSGYRDRPTVDRMPELALKDIYADLALN